MVENEVPAMARACMGEIGCLKSRLNLSFVTCKQFANPIVVISFGKEACYR